MSVEVEKKYRLTREQAERVSARLREIGAALCGAEFEENTLYQGAGLDPQRSALRLRRAGGRAVLTYKERDASASEIKRHREEETQVENAGALAAILAALGYRPALVYEKRREVWRVGAVEVVVDELPFGLYLEIEGEEETILEAERSLGLKETEVEMATYPELTALYGDRRNDVVEARFLPATATLEPPLSD